MSLNDRDVIQIIGRVGVRQISDEGQRSELLKDILAAWDFYQGYKKEAAKGETTTRQQYATKVAHAADQLFHLLHDARPEAEWVRRSIGRGLLGIEGDTERSLGNLTKGLMELAQVATTTATACAGM